MIIGILIAGVSSGIELYQDFRLATARQLTNNSIVGRMQGLTLWFETTSDKSFEKTTPQANESIAKWKNLVLSADKIDLFQTDSQYQPKYLPYAINNLPALDFNDNIRYLLSDPISFNDFSGNENITMFYVIRSISNSNPNAGNIFAFVESDANNTQSFGMQIYFFHKFLTYDNNVKFYFGNKQVSGCNLVFGTNAGTNQYNKCGNIFSYNFTDYMNKNFIFTLTKNSNVGTIYVNGAVNNSHDFFTYIYQPSNIKSNIYIGTQSRSVLSYIGEIIIFNRSLSDKEISNVYEYLKNKWKI